ncbi:MAG: DUF1549 domain-containing protein [Planctomycetes bacterium]|nr:DUF1549 domain-containing protein [Planctomycetota bacterium]
MKSSRTCWLVLVGLVTSFNAAVVADSAQAEYNTASSQQSTGEVSRRIDESLTGELGFDKPEIKSHLAPRTDDQTFLRRVYLDLAGELPTPTEVSLFALDTAADKRAKLVERLLADPRYGRNWARFWRDVIMYRRADDRALIAAASAERFLAENLNENKHWDEIVRGFLTGLGNISEKGTTALIMAQQADASNIASEVSRIFLGVQISCAQCHDHPYDPWKREQFHQFAAFFPRVSLRPVLVNGQQRGFEVASVTREPFQGRPAAFRGSMEHYMPDLKDPASRGTLMTPIFFATGEKLETGVADLDRRGQLADWMTSPKNVLFAKALVNRVWGELAGEGFYEPVDDMGPGRKATAPQTLDYLAQQFAAHQYDLKWLFRTIMATDTYQRASRPRRSPNDTPFLANTSYRVRSDVLYDNLAQALGFPRQGEVSGNPYGGGQQRFLNQGRYQFSLTFGYDPSERRENVASSIPQTLILMNSRQWGQAVSAQSGGALAQMLSDVRDDEQLVGELYLRFLAREPNDAEINICLEHVKSSERRSDGFEDIVWTLLNRSELLYRN